MINIATITFVGVLVGIVSSTITTYIATTNKAKQDRKELAENVKRDTELIMKVDFIGTQILEIKNDYANQLEKINANVRSVEADVKDLTRRIQILEVKEK